MVFLDLFPLLFDHFQRPLHMQKSDCVLHLRLTGATCTLKIK